MSVRNTVVIALVVVVAVVAPSVGAVSSAITDGDRTAPVVLAAETNNETGASESAPLGSQISAFMQATAAETSSSVESRMWEAEFRHSNGTNRSALVDTRTGVLEDRLDRLEADLAAIRNETDSGPVVEPRLSGKATSLMVRIQALRSAINETETAARGVGVNTTTLERLQRNASNVSGQEVAAIARNLTVVGPPADRPGRGPPEDTNGTRGPPDDSGQGPPEESNRTQGPPEETDQGPPENANRTQGPPDDTDQGTSEDTNRTQGPPEDTNGTQGPPENTDRGPPDDTDQRSSEGSNRTQGPSGNSDQGPPEDADQPGSEETASNNGTRTPSNDSSKETEEPSETSDGVPAERPAGDGPTNESAAEGPAKETGQSDGSNGGADGQSLGEKGADDSSEDDQKNDSGESVASGQSGNGSDGGSGAPGNSGGQQALPAIAD